MAGGAKHRIQVYTTEGGWLQLSTSHLVEETLRMKASGFAGAKVKVGKPSAFEDLERLTAVRKAVGDSFEVMVDANQSFSVSEAIRRAALFEQLHIAWFEEPLPADNVEGHVALRRGTRVPIAVGESLYSLGQFRSYVAAGACSIVQVDVARIGGITPWLKAAHLAEAFGLEVCPHFLMELHVALCCAVPNSRWLEHIPQLDAITAAPLKIENGFATPSQDIGLGIDWDWDAVERLSLLPRIRVNSA
jgi:L-alanine-DL-glutamate epimerase-like enolase superfamily enzyme